MKRGSCSKVLPILSNKAEEKIHWALSELNAKNNEKHIYREGLDQPDSLAASVHLQTL